MPQFADENAHIESLGMAFRIVGYFRRIAGQAVPKCKENEGAFVGYISVYKPHTAHKSLIHSRRTKG